jgi:hypothetical protein
VRVYRYPLRSLVGDYLRASVGLAVGVIVLVTVPPSPAIVAIFGGLTVLFLVFGLRTVQRHMLQVALTDDQICGAAFRTRILPWDSLERLKLRYYGTRRQRRREDGGGFMQLSLKGGGAALTLESSIDGFERIAWRAAKAARDNGVSLDPTSAGNLLDLGIDADRETLPPPDA